MLGKTHVVGSLAVAHVGLLGYSMYRERVDASEPPLQVFDIKLDQSLSFGEYTYISAMILVFVLWLLRVGTRNVRIGYIVALILGLIGITSVFDSTRPLTISFVLLSFALGSLLPDIDSENSTIGRYIAPISRLIPHRTYTHTIWVVLLLFGIGWYIRSIYVFALALGYTLHIVEDSFSKQGIRWFYPMRASMNPVITYRTGGTMEIAMFYGAIAIHGICAGIVIWSQFA